MAAYVCSYFYTADTDLSHNLKPSILDDIDNTAVHIIALPHSPEDFLVRLVGVPVIGHDAWLEVFGVSVPRVSLGISSAQEKPPISQLIPAGVIGIPLRPGHHQKAQTAPQRQPEDEGQSRPEHGQKGGKTHIWQLDGAVLEKLTTYRASELCQPSCPGLAHFRQC